jgi:hypothetical protein
MHNPNVTADSEAKEHFRQVVEWIQGPGVAHDDYSTEPSRRDTGNKEEGWLQGGLEE